MEDECHLLWGDTLGYVWGKRNKKIDIPVVNERERQTYYGAVNCFTGNFHVMPFSSGNGENTVEYVKHLQTILGNKKILLIWDGASYHRYSAMQEYLQIINKNFSPENWQITCVLFAPNAPEQNPVEDIWLLAKNNIRKFFIENKTFAQVKKSFLSFLKSRIFFFPKIQMYRDFIL